MKLKNIQIYNINNALSDLVDLKLSGRFKFKLYRLKVVVEQALEPVYKAIEGATEDEANEVLNEEQDVEIDKLTFEELENLDLSIRQLGALEPIMEEI